MKPLSKTKLQEFLERFEYFKGSEFRSLEVIDATTLKITYALQDGAKEFDWITLSLEFSGVSDARILEDTKMSFTSLDDGVSLLLENNMFAFCVGECATLSCIREATYYIIAQNIKYEEGEF